MSELLALEWRNVDLENKEIRIVQTVEERSARRIPIDDKAALRKGYNDLPWVFWSDRTGRSTARRQPWKAVRNFAAKAGVGEADFHRLRHATLLLRQGVHLKIVGERLGHSVVSMTERYSHVLPDSQLQAVKAMEKMNF